MKQVKAATLIRMLKRTESTSCKFCKQSLHYISLSMLTHLLSKVRPTSSFAKSLLVAAMLVSSIYQSLLL